MGERELGGRHERRFRFGVINERPLPPDEWLLQARRIEALGYATFLIRDHLRPDFFGPQYAPITVLATAAAASTTLRVGTLVFDNDFHHPALLAKEAATLDVLSDGRFELGLGAGWLRAEYEAAGLPFDSAGTRIERLAESIRVLKGLFASEPLTFHGDYYAIEALDGFPKPLQRPHPPLLLGGGKRRMLTLAGREADIVSLLTTSVASGSVRDDPNERFASSVEEKLSWVREGAGARFDQIELSLIPTVLFTHDREETAAELLAARGWGEKGATVADVLSMPSVLIGTTEEIVDQLELRHERYGFSYYVVSDTFAEPFAPIVARLAGR